MKKKLNNAPLIGLTCLGFILASCGGSSSSPTWSEKDAKLIKDNFYGVDIPYVNLENKELEYYDDERLLVLNATNVSEGFLKGYASNYSKDNGWIGGDVSKEAFGPTASAGTGYAFEKVIKTEEGYRYVDVFMYTYTMVYHEDDEEYYPAAKLNGDLLRLTINDPYYYEYPEEAIKDYILQLVYDWSYDIEDYIVPPSFEADYYYVDMRNYALLGYVENGSSDDLGYTEELVEAGFKVANGKDEYGFYNAISPDDGYQVYYIYNASENTFFLGFEGYKAPIVSKGEFDNTLLEEFFTGYSDCVQFIVPQLNIENADYLYYEDENNIDYYMDNEYEKLAAYVSITGENVNKDALDTFIKGIEGWNINEGENLYELTQVDEYRYSHKVVFAYDEDNKSILVTVFLYSQYIPYDTWPTEAIEAAVRQGSGYLGDDLDELPSYSKEGVQFKINGNTIYILCGENDPMQVYDQYISLLLDNGFTPDVMEVEYTSPNEQYVVYVTDLMNGEVEILISFMPQPIPTFDYFPLQEVLDKLNASSEITDTLIGIDGADQYTLNVVVTDHEEGATGYDVFGDVNCFFNDTTVDAEKLANDYLKALREQYGYTDYDVEEPDGSLRSPNNQLKVSVEVEGEDQHAGYLTIVVHFDNIIDGVL